MSELCNNGNSKSIEFINKLRIENQTLLDKVNILKLQCKSSNEETQNAREKLACLKLLVKRAWSGDTEAAVHVSTIVGIAPPLFETRENDASTVFAIPQSRALNNWVTLSVGLLDRLYKQREDVLYVQKREYLLEREQFLDSQLDGYINDNRIKDERDLDVVLAVNQVKSSCPGSFQPKLRSHGSLRKIQNARRTPEHSTSSVVPSDVSIEEVTKQALLIEPVYTIEDKETSPGSVTGVSGRPISATRQNSRPQSGRPQSGKPQRPQSGRPQSGRPRSAKISDTDSTIKSALKKVGISRSELVKGLPRQKSARTVRGQSSGKLQAPKKRPCSATPARVTFGPLDWTPSQNQYRYASKDTLRQLDVVEKELQKTTALLQKKLSINPLNFVD